MLTHIQERVIEAYLKGALLLVLFVLCVQARHESEYCRFIGLELSFEQAFWTGYSCKAVKDKK